MKWVIVLNMALSYHSEHVCAKHAQSGKLSFSNRFSVYVWTGENDAKMLRVDANVFWKRRKKVALTFKRIRICVDCGQALTVACNATPTALGTWDACYFLETSLSVF